MADEQTKEEVAKKIIAMFNESIGWDESYEMPLDANLAIELKVDSDDLSFFIVELEDYFDMRLTQNEWGRVGSMQETIDLVMQYRGMKLRPEPEKGLWAWLRRWIF